MKKVLITAKNSYIGNSFASWAEDTFEIDFITCRTNDWRKEDFSKYDSILHVAGIAHVSTDPQMEPEYYRINRDLTIELAKKAKIEGVKQFLFMSSIIVYGDNNSIKNKIVINKNTLPSPSNFYGESKLEAEKGIIPFQNENFKVAIIRPPMVYGENSKGNFQTLSKLAQILPVFPQINNERSMIHIDNLCELIRLLIKNSESGIFYPQNKEYVNTTKMVLKIAEKNKRKIWTTKLANPLLFLLSNKLNIINKAFGSLVYDKNISIYKEEYQLRE